MKRLPIASMAAVSGARPAKANLAEEAGFRKTEEPFRLFQRITAAIKELWPAKTTAHVAYFADVSERSVRFWLAGSTRMSVEHVAALLRTDDGYRILEAIMGDAEPEWWLTTKVAHELRQTRRAIAAQQKRIDKLRARQKQIDLFDE